MKHTPPTIAEIRAIQAQLKPYIYETPICYPQGTFFPDAIGANSRLCFKLELLQATGTFKARGALASLLALSAEARKKGVVAASAGNHGVAVSYAASVLDTKATIFVPKTASAFRVAKCRAFGGTVELVDSIHEVFTRAEEFHKKHGAPFIHPYEGRNIACGTGTLGLELIAQCKDLDAVVVPIGGGGLMAGVAAAVKQLSPTTKVYGVEPTGADSMWRSLQSGKTESIPSVQTIADSLGAPRAEPYSFSVCKTYVDEVVRVTDEQLLESIYILFRELKLAVEPAGAASTAAALGPLKEKLRGKKTALIVCGANISAEEFAAYVVQGRELFEKKA